MSGLVEKVYSQALFEIGCEENSLPQLFNETESLKKIFNDNPELSKLLSAPTVNAEEKQKILKRLFGGRVSERVYNLLCVVTEKNRAAYFVKIADEFKRLYYDKAGILEITAITAEPMSENVKNKLKAKFEQVSKKKILLTQKTDKSILGGIVVEYGSTMMDASLKTKLDALHGNMTGIIA